MRKLLWHLNFQHSKSHRQGPTVIQLHDEVVVVVVVVAVVVWHPSSLRLLQDPTFFFQHCAQAFEVFNLGGCSVDAEGKLARIAQACDLEEAALISEWKDVYPRAQRLLKANASPQDKNKHAWALAMARLSDHHHGRARHPVQVLREALLQYHAFGASSSGVEQSFSRAAWAFGNRNGCARPSTEEFSVKALLDLPKVQDTKSLFRLARVVWVCYFGEARQVCRERIDKGMPRNNQIAGQDEATEAGFIRRRRRAELEAGRRYEESLRAGEQSNCGRGSSDSSDSDVWTQKHEKELQFQNRKLKQRKIQACAENSLLPDEIEDGMLEEARTCKKNMLAREAARHKKQQKVLAAEQGCSLDEVRRELTAKTAFLAVAASEELRRGLGQLRLRQVPSVSDAEVIICSRPGFLADPRHRLLSALKGGYELSAKLLTHRQGAPSSCQHQAGPACFDSLRQAALPVLEVLSQCIASRPQVDFAQLVSGADAGSARQSQTRTLLGGGTEDRASSSGPVFLSDCSYLRNLNLVPSKFSVCCSCEKSWPLDGRMCGG